MRWDRGGGTSAASRFGAKAAADPDLVRAVAVAASLDQRQSTISTADTLGADRAKLDALSLIFAIWGSQTGSR